MSRYPRTCRGASGPHVIAGPSDEAVVAVVRAGGRRRTGRVCAACRRVTKNRAQAARVADGRHAETVARSSRRAADAADAAPAGKLRRIPRTGDETKTKCTDN
jgi:hypothetical protein